MLGQQPSETFTMMRLIDHAPGEKRLPARCFGKAATTDDPANLLNAEIGTGWLIKEIDKQVPLCRIKKIRNIAVKQNKTGLFVRPRIGPDAGHAVRTIVIR